VLFNVATLLGEPTGAARHFAVSGDTAEVPDSGYHRAVSGDVRMLRTSRGILVRARLRVSLPLQCAWCLTEFETDLSLDIDEVFAQRRDPLTGEPLDDLEPDDFRIIDEQYLDLSEAVRQYEEAVRPMSPLCKPDCRGLCPQCGRDLNYEACDCEPEAASGPWSALAGLAEQLQATEGSRGRSEA
jgi:uncharacterized protein